VRCPDICGSLRFAKPQQSGRGIWGKARSLGRGGSATLRSHIPHSPLAVLRSQAHCSPESHETRQGLRLADFRRFMAVQFGLAPSLDCTLRRTASASPRRAAALGADKPQAGALGMSAASGLQEADATCRPCAYVRQTVR
jgi:hypothetical protein